MKKERILRYLSGRRIVCYAVLLSVLVNAFSFLGTERAKAASPRELKVGDIVNFGAFEHTMGVWNYESYQTPIKWIVVERDTAQNTATLVTNNIIDARPWHIEEKTFDSGWVGSYLRDWLNSDRADIGGFLVTNNVFTSREKEALVLFDEIGKDGKPITSIPVKVSMPSLDQMRKWVEQSEDPTNPRPASFDPQAKYQKTDKYNTYASYWTRDTVEGNIRNAYVIPSGPLSNDYLLGSDDMLTTSKTYIDKASGQDLPANGIRPVIKINVSSGSLASNMLGDGTLENPYNIMPRDSWSKDQIRNAEVDGSRLAIELYDQYIVAGKPKATDFTVTIGNENVPVSGINWDESNGRERIIMLQLSQYIQKGYSDIKVSYKASDEYNLFQWRGTHQFIYSIAPYAVTNMTENATNLKKGDYVFLGEKANGESIVWQVVDDNVGTTSNYTLLATDVVGDPKPWTTNSEKTWDKSTLYDYLNGSFFGTTFGTEREITVETENEPRQKFKIIVSKDSELIAANYGSSGSNKPISVPSAEELGYLNGPARFTRGFNLNEGRSVSKSEQNTGHVKSAFWTRSTDIGGNYSMYVDESGRFPATDKTIVVDQETNTTTSGDRSTPLGVRPVLTLISSKIAVMTGQGTKTNPYNLFTGNDFKVWSVKPTASATGSRITLTFPESIYTFGGTPSPNDFTVRVGTEIVPVVAVQTSGLSGKVDLVMKSEIKPTNNRKVFVTYKRAKFAIFRIRWQSQNDPNNGQSVITGAKLEVVDDFENVPVTAGFTSAENALKSIEVKYITKTGQDAAKLTPDFDPEKTGYTLRVPSDVATIDLFAVAKDGDATIEVKSTGGKLTQIGESPGMVTSPLKANKTNESSTVITITVTALDNSKRSYTLTIIREKPSGDSSLDNLVVSPGPLIQESTKEEGFDPGQLDYVVNVGVNVMSAEIKAFTLMAILTTIDKDKAVQSGVGKVIDLSKLKPGASRIVEIVTTSESGQKRTYRVRFYKLSGDNKLANLVITPADPTKAYKFNPDIEEYKIPYAASVTTARITPTLPKGSAAKVEIFKDDEETPLKTPYDVKLNAAGLSTKVTVRVTPTDPTEVVREYIVMLNRAVIVDQSSDSSKGESYVSIKPINQDFLNGLVTTHVDYDTAANALTAVAASKTKVTILEIETPTMENAISYKLAVDQKTFDAIKACKANYLKVTTEFGSVWLTPATLKSLRADGEGFFLTIHSKVYNAPLVGKRPAISVEIAAGRHKISDLGDYQALVDIPYELESTEFPDAVVAMHANDDGSNPMLVKHSSYIRDEDVLRIKTSNFSVFAVAYNFKYFEDTAEHWSFPNVMFLGARDIIHGREEEIFEPDAPIKRVEFLKMLLTVYDDLDFSGDMRGIFTDVTQNRWFFEYVSWAYNAGIVKGYPDGTFGVDGYITRQEMSTIVYRFAQVMKVTLPKREKMPAYSDSALIFSWAAPAVQALSEAMIIEGKGDAFEPREYATRAETAKIIAGFIDATFSFF